MNQPHEGHKFDGTPSLKHITKEFYTEDSIAMAIKIDSRKEIADPLDNTKGSANPAKRCGSSSSTPKLDTDSDSAEIDLDATLVIPILTSDASNLTVAPRRPSRAITKGNGKEQRQQDGTKRRSTISEPVTMPVPAPDPPNFRSRTSRTQSDTRYDAPRIYYRWPTLQPEPAISIVKGPSLDQKIQPGPSLPERVLKKDSELPMPLLKYNTITTTLDHDVSEPSDNSPAAPNKISTSPVTKADLEKEDRLTRQLLLGRMQCGAPTKKEWPCRNGILKDNEEKVRSLLSSVALMTKSSLELDAALEKLVLLVHCQYHIGAEIRASRIEKWIQAFPAGQFNGTAPLAIIIRKMKKTLACTSPQCAGSTRGGVPCRRSIGGQKVQNCAKTIAAIVRPDVFGDEARVEEYLQVLEANRYCSVHISQQSATNVQRWKASLASIIAEIAPSASPPSTGTLAKTREGIETLMQNDAPTPPLMQRIRGLGFAVSKSSASLPRALMDPAKFWSDAPDATPFNVIGRGGSSASRHVQSSHALVFSAARRPLDAEDRKAGYVYLYEVENNPGFVKLGYTTRSIALRHDEWNFDCNRNSTVLYPVVPPSSSTSAASSAPVPLAKVPNARRVETLCHAELDHLRVRIYCEGCMMQHVEWFRVPRKEDVIAVIRKWSAWMRTEPYSRDENGEWNLGDAWKRGRNSMDEFLSDVSVAAQSVAA